MATLKNSIISKNVLNFGHVELKTKNASPYNHYCPDIDGLRAIAVLSVVGFHAFGIQAGFIGVDFFFVISGYLISTILFKEAGSGRISIVDFYRRRIRRIYPALLTVLAFCFALGWLVLLADEYEQLNKHIAAGLAFISNLVLLGESSYFDSASTSKILLHLWSLGIEEQFYIVWPLLILFFAKQRLKLRNWIAILLIASFALNIGIIYTYPAAAFYLPLTRFWELLIGAALAYRVVVNQKPALIFGSANFNSLLGLVLLIAANIFINDRSVFPGWWALLPTLSAILFIAAGPHAWFNQHVLGSRLLVWFGLISYPLYLWHWPLLTFARILDGGRQPASYIRVCMVLLAILLAWLTYRFIEKPIRFSQKTYLTPARLFTLGCFLFLLASFTYLDHGLPNRSAAQVKILNAGDIGHDEFRSYLHAQSNYCEYKDASPNACTDKFFNYKRIVAVVGDSHAEHILLGLTEDMPHTGFMLFDTNQKLPFISSQLSNHFFDVINNNIKIDTVILVAYWNLRKPLLSSGDSYLQEIIPTTQKLAKHNKKVFLVDGIPNFSFLPSKCKFNWPLIRIHQCTESKLFHQQHNQYHADFIAAEKQVPIQLIQLRSLFCEGDICAMAKEGKLLFRDDNHLGINGSRLISPNIQSYIISK